MKLTNVIKIIITSFLIIAFTVSVAACGGPSTVVNGTIMRHDGEPFAGKEVVLVPLLPGEKIEIFSPTQGGKREVSLSIWDIDILEGEKIIFATDRSGRAIKVKTNSEGSFVIKNVDPGKYILLQMVAGSVIIMGTKDGFIRVVAEEGKTNDIGTITLLHPSESIIEWEKKHSQE